MGGAILGRDSTSCLVGVGIVSCIHPGEDDSSGLVLGNPTWWSHQVKDVLIYSVVVWPGFMMGRHYPALFTILPLSHLHCSNCLLFSELNTSLLRIQPLSPSYSVSGNSLLGPFPWKTMLFTPNPCQWPGLSLKCSWSCVPLDSFSGAKGSGLNESGSWASARGRGVKQCPEPAVSSWSLLHVITLFSVLSTNRAINTNVLGELSSAKP